MRRSSGTPATIFRRCRAPAEPARPRWRNSALDKTTAPIPYLYSCSRSGTGLDVATIDSSRARMSLRAWSVVKQNDRAALFRRFTRAEIAEIGPLLLKSLQQIVLFRRGVIELANQALG